MPRLSRRLRAFQREWRAARRSHPVAAIAAAALVVFLAAAPILGSGYFAWSLWRDLPDEEAITRIGEMAQATAVYDYKDELAFTIFKEQRFETPLADISPNLIQAILAIEDQRFYRHRGFDLIRIASAALANVREMRAAQGGSTITQQLARQSFLTQDKTIRRKVQELLLAERIERAYSKDRILELYLNKVYFGDGLYGVEAASRGFFGKPASDLTVAEAALIAGLVRAPSSYAPTIDPDRAIERRNLVLMVMRDSGAIDEAQWESARAEPLVLENGLGGGDEEVGQFFKEEVRRQLAERFGLERVNEGGLRVYSTVDMEMQAAAEEAIANGLATVDERRLAAAKRRGQEVDPEAELPQAALISLEPATGHVRAMVGGRDFGESSFNRAVQARRQPGSAFKPFVYAAALEAGYSPASLIRNLDTPIATPDGDWVPEDEQSSANELTLRTALRISSNRAAVRLLQDVGIPHTVRYARTMGVGDVPSVPSLALGSGEVTLQAITAAYAAFINAGKVPRPLVIRRVDDRDGVVLFEAEDESTQAVSETTAFLMSSMLADVINAGTAGRARSLGFTLPAGGKTGTTNEFRDSWFVGFTPHLATGVWVGFDTPQTIVARGFASELAVPIWANYMKVATKGDRAEWIKAPKSIVTASVCSISGQLAAEGCEHAEIVTKEGELVRRSTVYTEYFVSGTEPRGVCHIHSSRGLFGTVASWFGGGEPPAAPVIREEPPVVAAAPEPPPPAEEPQVEEPPRRRGFWSRVFGLGRDDDDRDADRNDDDRDNDDRGNNDRARNRPR
ncbi:MAG: penicillin-binding protein 1A [Vicinamibacterales bacterium]